MKEQKEMYERPFMERTLVELEDGFCTAASKPAKIEKEKVNITVEEYQEIDNSVAFD